MENTEFAKAIKNVECEKIFILTNENADIINALRLLPGNRSIKQERVNQIAQAFKNGEFIPPIIVSVPSREITEGNHRYMAALKCLKEEIPFTLRVYLYKDENALDTARVINNTQKRWSANDRLQSYVYEGRESYIELKKFMDQFPDFFKKGKGSNSEYRITPALCLLSQGRTSSSMASSFYTGKLVIKQYHVDKANQYCSELIAISEILGSTACFDRYNTSGWIKARERLGMSIPQFFVLLKKKAKSWTAPKDTAKAWFDMYLSIAGGF